jgi:hypothetical protein
MIDLWNNNKSFLTVGSIGFTRNSSGELFIKAFLRRVLAAACHKLPSVKKKEKQYGECQVNDARVLTPFAAFRI